MKANKIYLLYFDWANTSGNHAGMSYLCKYLEKNIPNVKSIKLISSRSKLLRGFNIIYLFILLFFLGLILKKNDKVFLMEYMARGSFQNHFAKIAKFFNKKFEIIGLVHLSGNHLLEIYKSKTKIAKLLTYPDKIMVFGTSLSGFIQSVNPHINVITTFHYVDNVYYQPNINLTTNNKDILEIICIGNIKRNFNALKKLVLTLPNINFRICQGVKDLSHIFSECPNVQLYGYLSEKELLNLMQSSDIGLSIMDDTIGSNVIVTSLACGLVQIVSDVGSIRDYCTENDSFFCGTHDEFKQSIELLSMNKVLLKQMKENALLQSKKFSLEAFSIFFNTTFCDG